MIDITERVLELSKLEDGWYDDNSVAPTESAVTTALSMAQFHDEVTSVTVGPTTDGGFDIELTNVDRDLLSIGITPEGKLWVGYIGSVNESGQLI